MSSKLCVLLKTLTCDPIDGFKAHLGIDIGSKINCMQRVLKIPDIIRNLIA